MQGYLHIVVVGLSLITASYALSPTVVDLGYAEVWGQANDTLSTITFWAIPFAQPPVGDLRWRAPVPIDTCNQTHKQVVNNTEPGFQCVQGLPGWLGGLAGYGSIETLPVPNPIRNSSEDCLLLDIITPERPRSSLLPVVVQIHSGGYTEGSSTTFTDGHSFVKNSNGSVIWVQIQYRLGAYGFLGGAGVNEDGDTNVGLLDQRLTLQWVQKYIRAFGGDPAKVTIWGVSAGGGSVTNHLIAFGGEAQPPYRAAIAEYPWWQPFHDNSTLTSQYELLLSTTNCTTIACMRALDSNELANATAEVYELAYMTGLYGYGDFYFGPYVDGKFIQDLPSIELSNGRWSKVPLLVDHDEFEGLLFTNTSITSNSEVNSAIKTIFQSDDPAILARFNQLYQTSDFGDAYIRSNAFFSDAIFGADFAAPNGPGLSTQNAAFWKLQAAVGDTFVNCGTYTLGLAAGNSNTPFWKMIFNAGIYVHGASGTYMFFEPSATGNAMLASNLQSYYRSFVLNLDPNIGSSAMPSPELFWPRYLSNSTGNFQILQVNQTAVAISDDTDANGRCDFWSSQPTFVKN